MWGYQSLTKPLVFFDFTPSRHREGPAAVLANYQGVLLGDCYAGFEAIALASDSRITRAACWAHVRRKFIELQLKAPRASARMRAWLRLLYDIEHRARGLSPDELRALRELEARTVLEKIREFL